MPIAKKPTKAQLQKKLASEAATLGLTGKARSGYINGVLRRLFPAVRAKKKLVARQANPARKKNTMARAKSKKGLMGGARTPAKRKKNPVGAPNKQTMIEHAMALFKRFRLDDPQHVDDVKYKTPEVGMVIGDCDGILYTTVRNGKTERYKHEFKKSARPLLVSSWDGKQILIVGGSYNFTQDGITDM